MGEIATIKDVFVQSQTGMQGHGKLVKTLQKIYIKMEFVNFWSEFSHYLKYAMIIFKREPAVERVIDFVSKFVPSLSKKGGAPEGDGEDVGDVTDNSLLEEMFDFLLQSHSAKDRGVRFRCCQLINKLLTNLGEDAQIDDDLYDRLYECMLERLKDKCPVVRFHAVMAMARLQDPSDENCPVIKAYLFLLNCDPNPDVRRAVLSSIAPSTKTLVSIIGRTRDVKDTVRKTAYEVLSEKVHIKAMSIALRLQLVQEGLNDRTEVVKQACSGKMLQSWLRTFGGNILDLLKSLDVEDSTDICSSVLESLFKVTSLQELVDRFDILDDKLLVPYNQLTCESALYWQAVCKYVHATGSGDDVYLDNVLPNCMNFCHYIQSYVDELRVVEDAEIQLGREFIIQQLLTITGYMDMADSASRKEMEKVLHNMLMAGHVSHRLVKPVVLRICDLRGTTEAMVPYFAETVSEIREPITTIERDVDEEAKRQVNVKIAGIRVQLNQLREDLDEAVKAQDFNTAAEIKAHVAELDAEKVRLLVDTEPAMEEIRTEKNDSQTLLKCQTIISEMLQQLKLATVNPTLQMLIESQIVPGIQNEDDDVRNMAMQALGLCCYLSKDLLVTYIPLFMQASQIDVESVRVSALQVLFDLLLIYGLEIVDANDGTSTDSTQSNNSLGSTSGNGETLDVSRIADDAKSNDSRTGVASKLVAIICNFLDGENSDLRTCGAEGLSKLLLSGRVVSSKILSHLILLWYNPLSEDDTHLRGCLGTFFPLYALAARANQEVVEEAFVPTLKTLLNAPATSPLAEVDVNNVAELMLQLSNTKLLTQNQNTTEPSQDNPGHDVLSEKVCNEILSSPDSYHTKLWVRILNQMEVSPDNEVVLKDLRILCYKMCKLVKDKVCVKGLQKFQATVGELVSKFVTNDDDLQLIDIEPVAHQSQEEAPQEAVEPEPTPKKKRVRGLYSQNLTLGLESESELDITEDNAIEVDASCLESRVSVASAASDTPSRRSRRNTSSSIVTEVAADDDVFLMPEVPGGRKRLSLEDHDLRPETENPLADQESPQPDSAEPQRTLASIVEVSLEEESPVKGKRKEPMTASDVKSPEKRRKSEPPKKRSPSGEKRSRSPEKSPRAKTVTPEKKTRSLSPGKTRSKTPEKRSPSKSPGKKMPSKSPVKTSKKSPVKATSKSPVKKAAPKSPVKVIAPKSPESRSRSAEKRRKSADISSPRSPQLMSPKKKPRSVSPEKKSPERKTQSKSPTKKAQSKSPVRKSLSRSPVKSQTKSPRKSLVQSPEKTMTKSPGKKTSAKPAKQRTRSIERKKGAKSPERKAAAPAKKPGSKSPVKKVPDKTQDKARIRSKSVEINPRIRSAEKKSPEKKPKSKSPERVKPQATNVRKAFVPNTRRPAVGAPTARSTVLKRTTKPHFPVPTKTSLLRGKSASALPGVKTQSNIRKAENKSATAASIRSPKPAKKIPVADTPEPKSPRATRATGGKTVADTPEQKSTAVAMRGGLGKSVSETPESALPSSTRRSQRKAVGTPDSRSSQSSVQSSQSAKCSQSSGASVTTSQERRTSAGGRNKSASSTSSGSTSSPEKSVHASKSLPETSVVESDEEDLVKRKARPSRRGLADQSSLASPAARSVKASSSDTLASPRQTTRSAVKSAEMDKSLTSPRPSRRLAVTTSAVTSPRAARATTNKGAEGDGLRSPRATLKKSGDVYPHMLRSPRQALVGGDKKGTTRSSSEEQENRAPTRTTRGGATSGSQLSSPASQKSSISGKSSQSSTTTRSKASLPATRGTRTLRTKPSESK